MTESFPRQSAATRHFQLGAPRSFHILNDGSGVLFLRSDHGRDPVNSLWVYDLATKVERKVADPRTLLAGDQDIPDAEKARRERMRETTAGITAYATDDSGNKVVFALSGQLFSGEIGTEKFNELDVSGPVIDPRVSPDGQRIAWSNGKDLFVCGFTGNNERNLTNETSESASWGLADFIAAEEFGRIHGYWWSPASDELIVERTDETPVQTWWISEK
ncbi:MAG: DPP IV N-terminal domain-containing protein, partial [Actinomycetes bacterium]